MVQLFGHEFPDFVGESYDKYMKKKEQYLEHPISEKKAEMVLAYEDIYFDLKHEYIRHHITQKEWDAMLDQLQEGL